MHTTVTRIKEVSNNKGCRLLQHDMHQMHKMWTTAINECPSVGLLRATVLSSYSPDDAIIKTSPWLLARIHVH